jgi:hypothetical protein
MLKEINTTNLKMQTDRYVCGLPTEIAMTGWPREFSKLALYRQKTKVSL